MPKVRTVGLVLFFALALAACSTTPTPGPAGTTPPPATPAPITPPATPAPALQFVNIQDGQTIQGILTQAPGATVKGSDVSSLRIELYRPDGSQWWTREEKGALSCLTGLTNGVCNTWTTTAAPDNEYRLRAVATLIDGSSLSAELRFKIRNQNLPPATTPPATTPPASPAPTPPAPTPPTPPAPTPPAAPSNRPAWNDVRSWMREDVGCNLNSVLASKLQMVTMSVKCTGKYLERADTDRLKASGKWVLAYEDVAVAAPWDDRVWPSMVNETSAAIKFKTSWGSYLADVTSDAWFRAVEKVVRDDLTRGYDGIWLDDCAAFWFEGGPTIDGVLKYSNIVKRVRALVDSIQPGVKLICNTDANLIIGSVQRNTGFLGALDGITIEGFTFHCFAPGDCRQNDPTRRTEEEKWALEAQKVGTKIFTLDYAFNAADQLLAWTESRKRSWTPAVNQGSTVGVYID